MRTILSSLLIALLSVVLVQSNTPHITTPEYPVDYRSWTHVKSVLVDEDSPQFANSGGIHHIYANELATPVLQGQQALPYPDGSTFVFDLLDVHTIDGTTSELGRKHLGVIEKNSDLYPETGGWGFAQFGGDSREPRPIKVSMCFGCHEKASEADFVFSKWRK